jgi:hypothetical protein
MTDVVISTCLTIAAIIHLLPIIGLAGAGKLTKLYAIPIEEPNLLILMQHRAILFGLLGAFLAYSAFMPTWQPYAVAAGLISALSFIVIAKAVGRYNAAIGKVVLADIVAVAVLLLAAVLLGLRHLYG